VPSSSLRLLYQVKRGWTCWADGTIKLDRAEAAKAKIKETRECRQKGGSGRNANDNLVATPFAFSRANYARVTDAFLRAIIKHVDRNAMEKIIALSQTSRVDKRRATQVDVTFDVDELVEGRDASSDPASAEDDSLAGWASRQIEDRGGMFTFLFIQS
jgi:hypothetical protein